MVAIEPDGRPVEVPTWQSRTAEERRRHEAAGRRRELREEIERATTDSGGSGWSAGGLVIADGVDGELAEELSGGVGDPDAQVVDGERVVGPAGAER